MPHFGIDYRVTIYSNTMLLFLVYGAALLDHALIGAGFDDGALIGNIDGKNLWCIAFCISRVQYTVSQCP